MPLAANVWTYLAYNDDRRLVPATRGMPAEVRRDDSPPLLPIAPFRPDGQVFLRALERLASIRQPWLHHIYDRVKERPYMHPFS
ncbi:hypothetical protein AB0C27_54710 [Nonomuraea sp. NPDC048882]|uniref:hypothetical protein n=1 Tax=Nonomuraea sp. NPDC048882 TaxID=3154347 RepID=UPI0033E66875